MDVINAGVKVFLYEKGYLHARTISIGSAVCSIGSANLDIRSFSINDELNAVSLPPAAMLFAIVVFGHVFGLPGVFLAVPLTVTLMVVVKKL